MGAVCRLGPWEGVGSCAPRLSAALAVKSKQVDVKELLHKSLGIDTHTASNTNTTDESEARALAAELTAATLRARTASHLDCDLQSKYEFSWCEKSTHDGLHRERPLAGETA